MNLLNMLKTDLGILTTTAYDERLNQMIASAQRFMSEEGITIDTGDPEDCQIIVMYAAWLWQRRDSGNGMPRMLRYALNNRVFREKLNG